MIIDVKAGEGSGNQSKDVSAPERPDQECKPIPPLGGRCDADLELQIAMETLALEARILLPLSHLEEALLQN